MKNKHIAAHMKSAFNYAECSTAERLKVGCVIVKDDRIISIGYNGMPSGWTNICEDRDFKTKPEVLHAEENAILHCAKCNLGFAIIYNLKKCSKYTKKLRRLPHVPMTFLLKQLNKENRNEF